MARSIIGSLWTPTQRNELNRMLEELYDSVFLFGDGRNFIKGAHIGSEEITARHYYPNSVGIKALATGAVTTDKIADGSVTQSKLSFNGVEANKGKMYPFENYSRNGAYPTVSSKIKNTILDVKIYGARQNKAYSIDSIRYGYGGRFGVQVSEWNAPFGNSIYNSSKETVISRYVSNKDEDGSILEIFEGSQGNADYTTYIASQSGYSVVITFDNKAIGEVVNLSENEHGAGQGLIIHPSNYIHRQNIAPEKGSDKNVYVRKTADKIDVFVKTVVGYTGYGLARKTVPYTSGDRGSNMDLWSIDRISGYEKIGEEFVERPNRVFVYSPTSTPTNTMDTIFRRVGDSDYSGGSYHGDEMIQKWKIFIGNYDATTVNGSFEGPSVEIIQETELYPDSHTAGAETTDAFMKVNKVHQFSYEKGYQLFTRTEALTDVELEMSNIGAFSARRVMADGSSNNFTDVIGIDTGKHIDVRTTSAGNQFSGQNETRYKFAGWYKQVLIDVETDSDFLDTWVRNYAEHDIKMYTRIIPTNGLMEQGKIINSSVAYKFDVTG